MSTDSTTREVFEDVEADPDGVLEAFGVDDPEDLVLDADDGHEHEYEREHGRGAHDPTTDATLDADDATAAELFDELASVAESLEASEPSSESEPQPASEGDAPRPVSTLEERSDRSDDGNEVRDDCDADSIDADVFVSDPTVTVERGSGDPLEDAAADPSGARGTRTETEPATTERTVDGFTLVGRPPEPVRVASDAFGFDPVAE